jgi:hypothetical protein
MLPWPFASKVNCDNALLCRQIYTSAVTSRGTRLEIELSQSALGFLTDRLASKPRGA